MKTCFHADVRLDKGETFELRPGAELRVIGTAGTLWITVDHDVRDVVLEPGGAFTAPVDRRCLVHALADTRARWCTGDPAVVASARRARAVGRPRLPAFAWGAALSW